MGLFHQGLTGILPVSNFDEVRAFYEDRLGLVKTQEWTDPRGQSPRQVLCNRQRLP